jgi:hypothetical protein
MLGNLILGNGIFIAAPIRDKTKYALAGIYTRQETYGRRVNYTKKQIPLQRAL